MVLPVNTSAEDLVRAAELEQTRLASLRRQARQSAELAKALRDNKALHLQLETAEQRIAGLEHLRETAHRPYIAPPLRGQTRRGTLVLLCSDWHVGETVVPETVGGRNEYTPAMASKRVDRLIEGVRWLVESWRGPRGYGWSLDELVVWLGGDLMTGMIHEDLAETNAMSPLEEQLFARDLCCRLLDALAGIPGIRRLRVVTSRGNHGRDTRKKRFASGYRRSYEQAMYIDLARLYAGHKRISVSVSKDTFQLLEVYRTRLRFHHGDCISFQGGVGGLTIPLRKAIAEFNKTQWADVTCMGHWHQYLDLPDAVVNNCLIGWGPYAQEIKAPFARASQVAFLVDEKWGKRMTTEIVVQ